MHEARAPRAAEGAADGGEVDGEGGGLGARHCVAIAMFEAGKFVPAATQLEAIERDMGTERPGVRAELLGQAGQAWMEANQAENAAAAQSRALDLKPNDADLWVDRGLSYAAMRAWPRAISDFDRALRRAQQGRDPGAARGGVAQAGDPPRRWPMPTCAEGAPDHSEALLERGFALLARGDRKGPAPISPRS